MSVSLTFRCPDDLAALIASQVEVTEQDKTSVVVGMLRSGLPSLPLADRNKLPDISAIYFVYSSNKLLYIGKTINLRNRFLQHHRIVQFVEAGADTRISWFPVTVDEMPSLEDSLIELLEPELNGEVVIGGRLATFRIEPEKWESFKALAKINGSTASVVLLQFIDDCLDNKQIPSTSDNQTSLDKIEALIDKRIEDNLAVGLAEVRSQLETQLEAQMEELRGKLKAR